VRQSTSKVDGRSTVVEWKFADLDGDSDGLVTDRELERLARLVTKLVRPTSCAVSLHRRCDLNRDSTITLHEWTSCFNDDDDDDGGVEASLPAADDDGTREIASSFELKHLGSLASRSRSRRRGIWRYIMFPRQETL